MTTFVDGPAKGQTLMLKRSPCCLRVTVKETGDKSKPVKYDALDQLEDKPEFGETVYVYELTAIPGVAFIDGAKIHGRYSIAQYKLMNYQPSYAVLIDNDRWEQWCNLPTNGPRVRDAIMGNSQRENK